MERGLLEGEMTETVILKHPQRIKQIPKGNVASLPSTLYMMYSIEMKHTKK